MSIPRLAIHRPVTMFMISFVIVLLGAISLTRLPVDLMPDTEFPSITVRVGYAGVGPLEMEELVTRPIEQAVSAVAGLERVESTSSEGNAIVRLNFAWGTDLSEAADDVRTRIDRVRGRLPEDADPPTIFKFDSNAMPIMGIGLEGDYDPVTLRELAQNDLSPRLERVTGVAAVTVDGGLRRQIRVDLSREKITALNLSPDRIVQMLRTENQNIPLGEVNDASRTLLLRSPGQFVDIDEIRDLVVLTREGVPVYMKDIAEVRDTTEDKRSLTRINGRPGIRMRVTKQSGTNTVKVAEGLRREVERLNGEITGMRLQILDDQSVFINRAIHSVQEHAMIGSLLVIAIIFLFLRDLKSTLIICTSIPISVIGTFALLYFGGYTLNTLTFGGLALGIGMIVDAAIVVLENTYRHLEMGKDRITAAIDGSEEVWSAILASTLTHIAVFVPMLFLTGVSSIMFGQLAAVVSFSLAMSLLVAVTIVPVLCSRLLDAPTHGKNAKGLVGVASRGIDRMLDGLDAAYARTLHLALHHRPTVFATGFGLFLIAIFAAPPNRIRVSADHRRGRSHGGCRAGRGHAHREHRERADSAREQDPRSRARSDHADHPGGWRRRLWQCVDASRQCAGQAGVEDRTTAQQRADFHGPAPSARRHSRRHRPRPDLGRPADARHGQPGRWPSGGRDHGPQPRHLAADRAGRQDAARYHPGRRRFTAPA